MIHRFLFTYEDDAIGYAERYRRELIIYHLRVGFFPLLKSVRMEELPPKQTAPESAPESALGTEGLEP